MRALLPRIPRALHLFFSLWASLRFCVSQGLAGLSGLRSVSLGFCGPLLVCLEFFWASQGCSGFRCIPLWVSRDLTSLGLCASLGLFELLSPSLAPSRGLWASTDLWISLGLAGILWTSLDLRGFLNLSGPLGIFGAHLGFSGPFRISLGLLGALLDYIYVPFWVSLILSEPLWGFLLLPGPL